MLYLTIVKYALVLVSSLQDFRLRRKNKHTVGFLRDPVDVVIPE